MLLVARWALLPSSSAELVPCFAARLCRWNLGRQRSECRLRSVLAQAVGSLLVGCRQRRSRCAAERARTQRAQRGPVGAADLSLPDVASDLDVQ